jgi:anthranilate phosphoribosyltransferase
LGFEKIDPKSIEGGSTVKESADIFKSVLEGNGSSEQNNVVVSNAAVAIRTIKPDLSFADCFYEAEEALLSKKALLSFKKMLS